MDETATLLWDVWYLLVLMIYSHVSRLSPNEGFFIVLQVYIIIMINLI